MAKAQLKRAKKELEKLQRSGRHMEWLATAQTLPLTPELQREIDKAWQEAQRRALRTPEAFDDFCRLRGSVGNLPPTPEVAFLLTLADLMDSGGAPEAEALFAVNDLTGLFLAAQKQLRQALAAARDWRDIEAQLALFERTPEKIARKHYQTLAAHFSGTLFEQPFLTLGNSMTVFRKLNHKTNLLKPPSDRFLDGLDLADQQAWNATGSFSPALRRLVLLPFAAQVLLHLRQSEPTPANHQVQQLALAVELTFMHAARPLVSNELFDLLFAEEDGTLTDGALRTMEQAFPDASFERKLALLRDVRRAFDHQPHRELDVNPFFAEFLANPPNKEIERLLISFYKGTLQEIGRRGPHLTPRDRRALVAFLDPLLAMDATRLSTPTGGRQALAGMLRQAEEAGCMGCRLATSAHFVAIAAKDGQLEAIAAKALHEAPTPGLADLGWIMHEYGSQAIRSPALLQALFTKIQGNGDLAQRLAQAVWREVNAEIMGNAFAAQFDALPGGRGRKTSASQAIPPAALKELAELANQVAALEPLRRLLTIFPDGNINVDALKQWFTDAWTPEGDCALFIETALALIGSAKEASLFDEMLLSGRRDALPASLQQLNFTKPLFDFLREHADDFRLIPTQTIEIIVENIFPHLEREPDFSALLIRTYNAMCTRAAAGETDCIALRDALDEQLRAMAGGRRRPSPTSKAANGAK